MFSWPIGTAAHILNEDPRVEEAFTKYFVLLLLHPHRFQHDRIGGNRAKIQLIFLTGDQRLIDKFCAAGFLVQANLVFAGIRYKHVEY